VTFRTRPEGLRAGSRTKPLKNHFVITAAGPSKDEKDWIEPVRVPRYLLLEHARRWASQQMQPLSNLL
jgi:hypothetical protein